jgi:phospholipid/cholesterol/gamma-HCH transport system permease protein
MEELGDPLTRLLVKLHLRRRRAEAGEGEARGDAREGPPAERWTVLGALELGLRLATAPLAYFGERALLLLRAAASVFDKPFRVGLILRQMQFVGVGSLPIVMLVGLFSGAVAAESSISALSLFRQEAVVGGLVGVSLARELSPVFAALMLSSRAGSGMAAELGSMRLTEQVEALVSFGVNPVQYLALPRIVAGAIMTPVLTMVFNVIGLAGAYVVAIHLKHVDPGGVMNSFKFYTDPLDYWIGIIKAVVFGISFSLAACYRGLNVRGGARELGRATTQAVVEGAVSILVLDYFLTDLTLAVWPPQRS